MENKWGNPEDWKVSTVGRSNYNCKHCFTSLIVGSEFGMHTLDYSKFLCLSCYHKHVLQPSDQEESSTSANTLCEKCRVNPIEWVADEFPVWPKLCTECLEKSSYVHPYNRGEYNPIAAPAYANDEHITREPDLPKLDLIEEWSDDLIGKKLVSRVDCGAYEKGYTITCSGPGYISTSFCAKDGSQASDFSYTLSNFAIAPDQETKVEVPKIQTNKKVTLVKSNDWYKSLGFKQGVPYTIEAYDEVISFATLTNGRDFRQSISLMHLYEDFTFVEESEEKLELWSPSLKGREAVVISSLGSKSDVQLGDIFRIEGQASEDYRARGIWLTGKCKNLQDAGVTLSKLVLLEGEAVPIYVNVDIKSNEVARLPSTTVFIEDEPIIETDKKMEMLKSDGVDVFGRSGDFTEPKTIVKSYKSGEVKTYLNGKEITKADISDEDKFDKLYKEDPKFKEFCYVLSRTLGQTYEGIKKAFVQVASGFKSVADSLYKCIDVFSNQLDITHSATLKFSDGEVIEIPPPEGDWESITLYDEWTKRRKGQRSPQVFNIGSDYFIINFPSFRMTNDDARETIYVTHDSARMIGHDYAVRIYDEKPELVSLTMHIRKKQSVEIVLPHPLVSIKALSNRSGFWMENGEVTFEKKIEYLGAYPGADKRPPEKKWSGVWMEKHAPVTKDLKRG